MFDGEELFDVVCASSSVFVDFDFSDGFVSSMAQSRVFSIIGDSNVKRNLTLTNKRACPSMSTSQFLDCHKVQLLEAALGQVRPESNTCILACISNFLTDSDDDPVVAKRIEPVLDEFSSVLRAFSSAHPDVTYLVSPPMYRKTPLWYREGLPEILTKFSLFMRDRPMNVHLMPSFSTPEFERDGIHLSAYSGLEYMIHLFDSSIVLIEGLNASCDERLPVANEDHRLLEDRVVVLKQDHLRLSKEVEHRAALDAELHDFHENVSNEAFAAMTGCSRIVASSTKEWQERAKKEVAPVLKELMGRDIPIEYISNSTGPQPNAEVRFNIKFYSVDVSKEVRTRFGSFYLNGRDERLTCFKPYSIRNLVTQNTRIRIAILQVRQSFFSASGCFWV